MKNGEVAFTTVFITGQFRKWRVTMLANMMQLYLIAMMVERSISFSYQIGIIIILGPFIKVRMLSF